MWSELWISLKEKCAEFIDLSWKLGGVLSPRNVKELVCLRDCFHLYIHLMFLRMHPQCLLTKTHFICYCYEETEVNLFVNCEKKIFCALSDGWHRVVAPQVHFYLAKRQTSRSKLCSFADKETRACHWQKFITSLRQDWQLLNLLASHFQFKQVDFHYLIHNSMQVVDSKLVAHWKHQY